MKNNRFDFLAKDSAFIGQNNSVMYRDHTLIRTMWTVSNFWQRPLDTPKRMIEVRERKKGRRRDIEREGEIERVKSS